MNAYSFKEYLRFRLHARQRHGVFPLSVQHFIKEVLKSKTLNEKELEIEKLRDKLKNSREEIVLVDYGAGSKVKSGKLTVAKRARYSLKPQKQAKLIGSICHWAQADYVVELGTSFGLTTSYISAHCPEVKIITLEGDPTSAAIARRHFKQLQLTNIEVKEGSFDSLLPGVIDELKGKKAVIFIDGNHKGEALLHYLSKFSECCEQGTIFILDDIYWSGDMHKAWKKIIREEYNYLKIDMFHLGVLLPKEADDHTKDYYRIRF